MTKTLLPCLAALCAAVAIPAAVLAAPPGGATDTPGTPAGTLRVTTPGGPVDGRIGFCVENIRVDTASGPVAQQFMLKFDDHGSYGIGPYTPSADGSLCATVSTSAADHAGAQGGAADKIPTDLCDASRPHTLRLLSGVWGAPSTTPPASLRSISAAISVAGGTCGVTVAGTPAPTGPGGGGTTPGGTQRTAAVTLRSTTLTVRGTSLALKLTGGDAFARGSVVLRTRSRLAVGRSQPARRTLARGTFQIAAADRVELRLSLTPDGRSLMRVRTRLAGELTLTPRDAAAITRRVTVRRAQISKTKTTQGGPHR